MKVNHLETLEYYDCELLFHAEDDTGRQYVAIHDADVDNLCTYVVVAVERNALTEFKSGRLGLKQLLSASPTNEWYSTSIGPTSSDIMLETRPDRLTVDYVVPGNDYYITPQIPLSSVENVATEKGRAILELKLSGNERLSSHEVPATTMTTVVSRIVDSLKFFGNTIVPSASNRHYAMNILGAPSAGSVSILLVSEDKTDMFGSNPIIKSLEAMTQLIESDFSEHNIEAIVREYSSKGLKEIRLLAKSLSEDQTDLHLAWSSGRSGRHGHSFVPQVKSSEIFDSLHRAKKETTDTVEINGILDGVNVRSRTWSIIQDDRRRVSGKVEVNGPKLTGRTTGHRYLLTCTRTVDEMAEDIKPKFVATTIEELKG